MCIINTDIGQLQADAALYLVHYQWPPHNPLPHQLPLDIISNIEGPWVNNDEDRRRLHSTLRDYYTANVDILVTEDCLVRMFERMESNSMDDVFVKIPHLGRERLVFEIRAESTVDPNLVARLMNASTQEVPVDVYAVRMLKGGNERITEATKEAIITPYLEPRRSDYEIGSMFKCRTFVSMDEALQYAKQEMENKSPEYKDKLPKYPRTTKQTQWMINPTGDRLKWVVTITKMLVNDRKRRQ